MSRKAEPAALAPAEELGDGLGVGGPRVAVADVGGEEFEEAAGGTVAGVGDDRRDGEQFALWAEDDFGGGWLGGHFRFLDC